MGTTGRHSVYGVILAAISAVVCVGCGAKDGAATAKGETAPVTLEVKGVANKLPTVDEVAKAIEAEGANAWLAKRGQPDIYYTDSGYTIAGWVGFTADATGARHGLTFVGFDPAGKLAVQDGKPFVFGKSVPNPLPTDSRTARDEVKRVTLGRKPAEVKRVLGTPDSTRELGGMTFWYYPKRSKDEASGKDDNTLTVAFQGGYVQSLSFD